MDVKLQQSKHMFISNYSSTSLYVLE